MNLAVVTILRGETPVRINKSDYTPDMGEITDAEPPLTDEELAALYGGLRDDGLTVAEYVAAGYPATNYPPRGYASRSTAEEIAAAVAEQAAKTPTPAVTTATAPAPDQIAPAAPVIPPEAKAVVKKGKEWFLADTTGKTFDGLAGYKTEAEAWAAVMGSNGNG